MTIKSAGLSANDGTTTLEGRFEAKCAKPDANGCIEWLGAKTRRGYGLLRLGRAGSKRTTAHRIAWALKRGSIGPEILVLHRCDNPSCVNVDHLFLGSPQENTDDMIRKGRHGWRHGTSWQKLLLEDAERIFDLRRMGQTTQKIADWMGVSRPLISLVLSGKVSYTSFLSENFH